MDPAQSGQAAGAAAHLNLAGLDDGPGPKSAMRHRPQRASRTPNTEHRAAVEPVSTALAERISAAEFSGLIDRFYRAATKELFSRDALVEKLISEATRAAAGFDKTELTHRQLGLKGKEEPVEVWAYAPLAGV